MARDPQRDEPNSADDRFAEWRTQIDRITQEVYAIHYNRELFRGVSEITQQANLPASAFFPALTLWYAVTQRHRRRVRTIWSPTAHCARTDEASVRLELVKTASSRPQWPP
jgi:hypothetical protein